MANYFKISDLPVVESVPEGATVLAYANGEIMRVSGSKLGGGGNTIIFSMDYANGKVNCNLSFAECYAMLEAGQVCSAYMYMNMSGAITTLSCLSFMSDLPDQLNFMFFMNGNMVGLTYNSDGTIIPQ